MKIQVNGESKVFQSPINITQLLDELGYESAYVAVSLNMNCVPKSEYADVQIQNEDEIEILAPFQGG